eukprot:COSAG01_NODE_2115_length_8385_cov_65.265870_3_plen_214_part_00
MLETKLLFERSELRAYCGAQWRLLASPPSAPRARAAQRKGGFCPVCAAQQPRQVRGGGTRGVVLNTQANIHPVPTVVLTLPCVTRRARLACTVAKWRAGSALCSARAPDAATLGYACDAVRKTSTRSRKISALAAPTPSLHQRCERAATIHVARTHRVRVRVRASARVCHHSCHISPHAAHTRAPRARTRCARPCVDAVPHGASSDALPPRQP